MKRFLLCSTTLLLAFLVFTPDASAFGWKDVVKMQRAGVADSLILQKIEYSGTTFHLGADEIEELMAAGVSDTVISAMLRTEAEEGDEDDDYDYGYRYRYDDGYYAHPYYYPRRLYVGFGLGYYGPFPRYYYDDYYYYPRYRSRYGRVIYRGHRGPSTHRYRTHTRSRSYSGYRVRSDGASPTRYRGTVGPRSTSGHRTTSPVRTRGGGTSGPSTSRRR